MTYIIFIVDSSLKTKRVSRRMCHCVTIERGALAFEPIYTNKAELIGRKASLRDCQKNLLTEVHSGHQTFPRGSATRESLMTLWNALGQIFLDNPFGLSTVYTAIR